MHKQPEASWILRLRDSVPLLAVRAAAESFAADFNLTVLDAVPGFERQYFVAAAHVADASHANAFSSALRHPTDDRALIFRVRRPKFAPHVLHYQSPPAINDAPEFLLRSHFAPLCAETSGRPPYLPCANSSTESSHDAVEWMEPMRGYGKLKRRTLLSHSEVTHVLEKFKIHDPGFPDQWHLYNEIEPTSDINVTGVWEQGVTGKKVVVAIVDDGIDVNSNDLKEKIEFAGSYDFNKKQLLPLPQYPEDVHGTRCAGEVAAGRNNFCGVGVAFDAKVSGIRILSDDISPADEAAAYTYKLQTNHIYSCSFGPDDSGEVMQGPPANVVEAFAKGVTEGRGGRGAIYVFASGNGGRNYDDCNADGYANSPYTFTIGAIDRHGNRPYYQENCAAQLAVTYSGGDDGIGIFTTDVGSNSCTSSHSGTSAAAPIAAGIFALILSDVPDLHWRTLMHLVVETAVPFNHEKDNVNWQKQPWSGRYFSHHFGFGKIDTFKLLEAARVRKNVGAVMVIDSPWEAVEISLDDKLFNGTAVHNINIGNLPQLKTLEYVILTMTVLDSPRCNLTIELSSPNNITSKLLHRRILDKKAKDIHDWSFSSVAHWGENATGNWTVRVKSLSPPGSRGKLLGLTLRLTGESVNPPDTASNVLIGYQHIPMSYMLVFAIIVFGLALCWKPATSRIISLLAIVKRKSRRISKESNTPVDETVSPSGSDADATKNLIPSQSGPESTLQTPYSIVRNRPLSTPAEPPIWAREAMAEDN